MRNLICVALLGLSVAWLAPEEAQSAEQGPTLEQLRDQGVLYFKRDRYKQAMVQFNKAFATPEGPKDFTTVFYRAQAAHKLLLLEIAVDMVAKAKVLAGEDAKKLMKIGALHKELSALYGGVTIKPAKEETNREGRIFLEAKTRIINREKKKQFKTIRERFRSNDIKVPTTIYLPYGEYLANNVPFSLKPNEPPPSVEVFLQIVKKDEGIGLWWWIGAGATAVGAAVAVWLLTPEPEADTEHRLQIQIKNLERRP